MRREAIKTILLGAAGSTLIANTASAQSQCSVCYPQVPGEVAASVAPANTSYPPGDIRRYHDVSDPDWTSALRLLNKVSHNIACFIPKGTYNYSYDEDTPDPLNPPINWAIPDLHLSGERGAVLKFTGRGRAFILEAPTAAPYNGELSGLTISNLIIEGNPQATDGLYCRAIMRSVFRFIQVRNVTQKAFHIKFGLLNHFDTCMYSVNIDADTPDQPQGPTHGFYLDEDGVGRYTSTCTFTNCIVEGPDTAKGCALVEAVGNVFIGGTFEGLAIGIDFDTNRCHRNRFVNMWFEKNGVADIRIMGTGNSFVGCYFGSSVPQPSQPSISIIDAGGTIFDGCQINHVDIQSQGRHTLFVGVRVPDHPTTHGEQAFTGSASYKRIGTVVIDTEEVVVGSLPDVTG